MPFVSRQQEKWAFANKMPWAKRWADMTKGQKLPARKSQKRQAKRAGSRKTR
jgi:hypothetical protein